MFFILNFMEIMFLLIIFVINIVLVGLFVNKFLE